MKIDVNQNKYYYYLIHHYVKNKLIALQSNILLYNTI
jgi:hypothetical protein